MIEIWKDVKGFDGVYQVSNLGRVKGLERISSDNRFLPERILSTSLCSNGYLIAKLCFNGKSKRISVHRLVASAFIPNPNNLPHINHIDENKTNNIVSNLEWCTPKYNANYGTGKARARESFISNNSKEIYQFDLNGNFVNSYRSISEASDTTNAPRSEICSCCKMKESSVSSHGFMWRYAIDCPQKRLKPYSINDSSLTKEVTQYTLNGEFIRDYKSISEAVKYTKTRHSSIYGCCVGKYKTANGYKWKYKN